VALRQELEKALADCSRSLTLRPGHMPTLDTRALASLLKGDHSAALTDYEAILSLDDKEYGALYGRGLARLRLGRTEPGRADIAAASAGDPTVPPYYESLGLRP
jgi:lipoprotein NlpI